MAIDLSPTLGPHEGRELELLLSGEKPIALFYEEVPDEFLSHLNSDNLKKIMKTFPTQHANKTITFCLIYKNAPKSHLNELLSILEQSLLQKGFQPTIECRIGQLLGYREIDIEYYLNHIARRLQ